MTEAAVTPLRQAADLNLEAYWMPFTHNRYFKKHPRLVVRAKGLHYYTADGRTILDGLSGLWCCNAGHCHPKLVAAVQAQAAELDYATAFQVGHPKIFELAERVTAMAPQGFDYAFFANSGSEAVDTSLKIALAYHRVRGEGARTRFIGREKGYHGVGFGGISVGGMMPNRKMFGAMLPGVDHLPHTHNLEHMAFSRGQPAWGGHLAEELERIVALHDASTIAAVILEPMQGSAGVIVPPAGYLERIREICDRHGILLIFDEVITAFGRLGTAFGADRVGVTPDLITFAKGITCGAVPMGGVLVKHGIYDAFMNGPEHLVEFFHGYTYSGHPLAAAAGLAALDIYEEDGLFERARGLEPILEEAIHSLRGEPHVTDIRNMGVAAALDLEPIPDKPSLRALQVFDWCFQNGLLVRYVGDTIAIGPAYVSTETDIAEMVGIIRRALRAGGR